MLEKRRHRRLEVDLPVILRYKGRLLPATMLNISCGGMLLRAEDPQILNDAQVEVIFDLDKKEKDISVRGKILRATPTQDTTNIGVQFTNLFSMGNRSIEEYLGKNLN